MAAVAKYWRFVRLDMTGKQRIEELANVRAFFQEQFADLIGEGLSQLTRVSLEQSGFSDTAVQHRLFDLMQTQRSTLAEQSLRCYISHQAIQNCRSLSNQFGSLHGFMAQDLWPFVLDDVLHHEARPADPQRYDSFASRVLRSFDPTKGTLSTWISRQIKQHPELRQFLLQQGVCLLSDWAILNDTPPKRLQRILREFSHWTSQEIQKASDLLESYHAVYRDDRLQQGAVKTPCQTPTPEQLHRIALMLQTGDNGLLKPDMILNQLKAIAAQLRQYRITIKTGLLPAESLDQPETQRLAEYSQLTPEAEEHDEQAEFLAFYREQLLHCLDGSIATTIEAWVARLQRKRPPTDHLFLKALQLFHCRGQTMSQIAPQVGLSKQYEVTRLLKLKEFRVDIRHHLLVTLREQLWAKAQAYVEPDRLIALDQQLDALLDEQVSRLIQAAEAESRTTSRPAAAAPPPGLLARRLCHYLDASGVCCHD